MGALAFVALPIEVSSDREIRPQVQRGVARHEQYQLTEAGGRTYRRARRSLRGWSLGRGRPRSPSCRGAIREGAYLSLPRQIAELNPRLVTFNGNSFDLGVPGPEWQKAPQNCGADS